MLPKKIISFFLIFAFICLGYGLHVGYKRYQIEADFKDLIKAKIVRKGCSSLDSFLMQKGSVEGYAKPVVAITYGYSGCGGNSSYQALALIDSINNDMIATKIFTQKFSEIKKIYFTDNTLNIIYKAYKDSDPHCCPSDMKQTAIYLHNNELFDQFEIQNIKTNADKVQLDIALKNEELLRKKGESEAALNKRANNLFLKAESEKCPACAYPFYAVSSKLGHKQAETKLKELLAIFVRYNELRIIVDGATSGLDDECMIKQADSLNLPGADKLWARYRPGHFSYATCAYLAKRESEVDHAIEVDDEYFSYVRSLRLAYPSDQLEFETKNNFVFPYAINFEFSNWIGILATQKILEPNISRVNLMVKSSNHQYKLENVSNLSSGIYKEGTIVEFSGVYSLACVDSNPRLCSKRVDSRNVRPLNVNH